MLRAFALAGDDLSEGLGRHNLWRFMASRDIRERYARSLIGPFWITISMGVWVVAMSLLFGGLLGAPLRDVTPHITAGIVLWTYLSNVFNEGGIVLISNRGYFLQSRIAASTFVWLVLYRNLLIAAHHVLILLIVLAVFRVVPNWNIAWLLLGLPLFFATAFGVVLTLAVLTPRFRDLYPFVGMMMVVGFFFTPVMWRPTDLQQNSFIATYNPFNHLLAVVREPLLGHAPSALSLEAAAACAAAALVTALLTLALTRGRLAFWL